MLIVSQLLDISRSAVPYCRLCSDVLSFNKFDVCGFLTLHLLILNTQFQQIITDAGRYRSAHSGENNVGLKPDCGVLLEVY
jgi:hypothetical protein